MLHYNKVHGTTPNVTPMPISPQPSPATSEGSQQPLSSLKAIAAQVVASSSVLPESKTTETSDQMIRREGDDF